MKGDKEMSTRRSNNRAQSTRFDAQTYTSQTPSQKNGLYRMADTLYSADCREDCCRLSIATHSNRVMENTAMAAPFSNTTTQF